jgi:hypothetical protein
MADVLRDRAFARPADHRPRSGLLDKLDPRIAGRFADAAKQDLDAFDALVAGWLAPVTSAMREVVMRST